MASKINADTSSGLKLISDTSGVIEFQSAGTTKAGVNGTGLTGNASQVTALNAAAVTSGTLPMARLSGTLPALNGSALTALVASNLASGTLPMARLSGTLPALNGSALTNLPAAAKLSTASGSAPSYSARAWVSFNGTGTPSIAASGNVSSITDNGTGDYTINFATAMPDVNFAAAGTAKSSDTAGIRMASISLIANGTAIGTGFVRINVLYANAEKRDANPVNLAVFR
mgnify:CR=1 FL=1